MGVGRGEANYQEEVSGGGIGSRGGVKCPQGLLGGAEGWGLEREGATSVKGRESG